MGVFCLGKDFGCFFVLAQGKGLGVFGLGKDSGYFLLRERLHGALCLGKDFCLLSA